MGAINKFFIKKIRASSLTEVIVATSILLTIFAISIITLNNLLKSSVQRDIHQLQTIVEKRIYLYKNNLLNLPFNYKEENLITNIYKENKDNEYWVEFSVTNVLTNKKYVKRILALEDEKK